MDCDSTKQERGYQKDVQQMLRTVELGSWRCVMNSSVLVTAKEKREWWLVMDYKDTMELQFKFTELETRRRAGI